MTETGNFYLKSVKQCFEALRTSDKGLSTEEAQSRLSQYGENQLVSLKKAPQWLQFLLQFKDVFVIVLIVAGAISFATGDARGGSIMFVIVLMDACLGYYQEHKAESIMDSLKKLIQSPAKVYRDGELAELPLAKLVPGDILQIEEGDKVPADIRIVESINLRTNDFSLTGESMPQAKHSKTIAQKSGLGDRDNMVFLGTTVAAGNARGVVVATGMATEVGRIAGATQVERKSKSPLQMEIHFIANRITVFAIVIAILLFGVSIWQGLGIGVALLYALGLAVAVVPQALPMQITVALSNGVARLARENAVIRKLSAVETLGSTNVICTDKTGTLTKNEMTVKYIWFDDNQYEVSGIGYEPQGDILDSDGKPLTEDGIKGLEILLDAATMSSNAEIHGPDDDHPGWYPIGDPTEAALITVSTKLGIRSVNEDKENPEIKEFSFDSERKRMSSIRQFGDKHILCMKGALGSVLSVSSYIYRQGKAVKLTDETVEMLNTLNAEYSKKAMRVLAFGYRELKGKALDYDMEDAERETVLLGLMAMNDPAKEGVKEAVEGAHEAHIKTFIMTGDHAITAQAVGRQIHLSPENEDTMVITGEELAELGDKELTETMRTQGSLIFSRVSPEDKLRIVKVLKAAGEVVAVTGDGVNDAPALKSSHIGVAMGSIGTDVAKEASELILLDDSFSTLVFAIREGRTIYNNLKKTVLASMTSNGAELSIVLLGLVGASVFGWPIPLLVVQMLAIDLLAEILPLTALTFDPGPRDVMTAPPRNQAEHMLNRSVTIEIVFLGFLMGALGFANFAWFIGRTGAELTVTHDLYLRATTMSYTTIVFCQFINILSRRYTFDSLFNRNFWSNGKMLWSIAISIGLIVTAIYTPFVGQFFGFAPLSVIDWTSILAAVALFLLSHELIKAFKRRNRTVVPAGA
ncbi:MAG: cation-transporting P-type ATPase [Dehalococcoidia bacterium]|nr:cation-transporting P-type ATPase [Dehalococcoidia bacterium]